LTALEARNRVRASTHLAWGGTTPDRPPTAARLPGIGSSALGLAALATLAVLAAATGTAHATFPGKSGRIAFTRFSGDDASVLGVDPRTGDTHAVTRRPHTNWFADWAPGGDRLLFTSTNFDGNRPDRLLSIGADGSDPERLISDCTGDCLGDSSAAWAPSGDRIVFERALGPVVNDTAASVDLYTADPDGTDAQPVPLAIGHREPHDAQWSPDGERLAANVLNVGSTKPESASAIYVFRPDGSGLKRITPLRLNAGTPDWSPSGRRIVFNSNYEGQAPSEIYTVRPDGSGLTKLLPQGRGHVSFEASYSPNGEHIAFSKASRRHPPHIWTMRTDGSHLQRVSHGKGTDVQADWGPR
jgi:TolB protein